MSDNKKMKPVDIEKRKINDEEIEEVVGGENGVITCMYCNQSFRSAVDLQNHLLQKGFH